MERYVLRFVSGGVRYSGYIALFMNVVLFLYMSHEVAFFWFFWFYHVWIKTLPWYLMALVTSKHSMIILEKGGRGLLVHVV